MCKNSCAGVLEFHLSYCVGKDYHPKLTAWDVNLFDYEAVYGVSPSMKKADRLRYGESLMTHAVVLTGYHQDEAGKIVKWRVENRHVPSLVKPFLHFGI